MNHRCGVGDFQQVAVSSCVPEGQTQSIVYRRSGYCIRCGRDLAINREGKLHVYNSHRFSKNRPVITLKT